MPRESRLSKSITAPYYLLGVHQQLSKLNIKELKLICGEYHVPLSGNKSQIIARLTPQLDAALNRMKTMVNQRLAPLGLLSIDTLIKSIENATNIKISMDTRQIIEENNMSTKTLFKMFTEENRDLMTKFGMDYSQYRNACDFAMDVPYGNTDLNALAQHIGMQNLNGAPNNNNAPIAPNNHDAPVIAPNNDDPPIAPNDVDEKKDVNEENDVLRSRYHGIICDHILVYPGSEFTETRFIMNKDLRQGLVNKARLKEFRPVQMKAKDALTTGLTLLTDSGLITLSLTVPPGAIKKISDNDNDADDNDDENNEMSQSEKKIRAARGGHMKFDYKK